jgi:hypothetical protein
MDATAANDTPENVTPEATAEVSGALNGGVGSSPVDLSAANSNEQLATAAGSEAGSNDEQKSDPAEDNPAVQNAESSADNDLIKNPYGGKDTTKTTATTNNEDEKSPAEPSSPEDALSSDEQQSKSPFPERFSAATSPTIPETPPSSEQSPIGSPGIAVWLNECAFSVDYVASVIL